MSIFESLNDPILLPFIYIMITVLGILFGSFLNVLIYRIPKKEEFVKTSSHCMSCGHTLSWYDNIPLVSWLSLKGKCRYCKEKISIQYPLIELINGLLWTFIFFVHGISVDSMLISFMASGLLALSIIDFRTYEIANGFHIYFIILALIRIYFNQQLLKSSICGFFAVSIPLLILYLLSGGKAIGGGDVKLMAACGLFIGWKEIILALAIGCLSGSIIHLMRMKFSSAGNVLALGPYLSIGIFSACLFGEEIINWYLTLF